MPIDLVVAIPAAIAGGVVAIGARSLLNSLLNSRSSRIQADIDIAGAELGRAKAEAELAALKTALGQRKRSFVEAPLSENSIAIAIEPADFPAAGLPDEEPDLIDTMTADEFLAGVAERNRGLGARI